MKLRSQLTLTALVVGVCFLLAGGLLVNRSIAERGYIPATGKVLSSDIRKSTTSSPGSTTNITSWRLFVEYEYMIGGMSFVSDNVASSEQLSNGSLGQPPSEELEELARTFGPGKRVTVYVNPDAPDRAVLIKASLGGLWVVLVGALLTLAGALAYFRVI